MNAYNKLVPRMPQYEITGRTVLRFLVDRSGARWRDLCEEFDGWDMRLIWCLESLCEAGLISVDGVDDSAVVRFLYDCLNGLVREEDQPRIRASSSWRKLEVVLYSNFRDQNASPFQIWVSPWFGAPQPMQSMPIFVAHPFSEPFDSIYHQCIAVAAQKAFMTSGRASDVFSATSIINDIWSLIFHSSVVVAECTGRNPNVFYEMGIAHTLGKPIILICQNREDVPFDLKHIRYIEYEPSKEGLCKLEEVLCKTIYHAAQNAFIPRSY